MFKTVIEKILVMRKNGINLWYKISLDVINNVTGYYFCEILISFQCNLGFSECVCGRQIC